MFYDSTAAQIKKSQIRQFIADKLGVAVDKIPEKIEDLNVMALGGDSLDVVELAMEIEEEFDINVE